MKFENRSQLIDIIIQKRHITTSGCWEWIGSRNKQGYGTFYRFGRLWRVHRLVYMLYYGELDKKKDIDHLICNNPPCFNPHHLAQVTPTQNVVRENHRRFNPFVCPNGHIRTEATVYVHIRTGGVECRMCRNESMRRYRKTLREQNAL